MYANGPKIVTNGLVMCLDAGNTKSYPGSGTAWTDVSRNGNNGTLTNGPTFSSANGGGIVFDGTNDYVSTNYTQPAYTTSTTFTWNTWVKPTRNNDGDIIMGNRGTNLNFVKLTTNNMEYYPTTFGGAMPTGVWVNACVVKDGTNLYYYRGGVLLTSTTSSTTKNSNAFFIGGDNAAGEYGNFNIAIAQVYNKALSASEVLQNYNATKGRFKL